MSHRHRSNSPSFQPTGRRVTRMSRAALAASVSLASLLLAAASAGAQEAQTLPGTTMLQGGRWVGARLPTVAQGNNGLVMTIKQLEKRALLDWSRFDVAASETVHFEQDGVDWIALNRIFDNKPSEIAGKITAKGQVWLQNTNGIIFKEGAQVNAHSILATALTIREDQLYNGLLSGNGGGDRGILRNYGTTNPYFYGSYNVSPAPQPVDGLDPNTLVTGTYTSRGQTLSYLDILALGVIRDAIMQAHDYEGVTQSWVRSYRLEQISGLSIDFINNGLGDVLAEVTEAVDLAAMGDYSYASFRTNGWLSNGSNWSMVPESLRTAVAAQIKAKFVDNYAQIFAGAQTKFSNYVATNRVIVEKGATLTAESSDSASPGKIMLFGPAVENSGTLQAHDGQVIMAAGEVIRLSNAGNLTTSVRGGLAAAVSAMPPLGDTDPNWRPERVVAYLGRYNAIDMTATNNGDILVDRGAVSIFGGNVEQNGSILVTNGVRQRNGAIILQASHGFNMSNYSNGANYYAGSVTLGEDSITRITPDLSDLTGVAADVFTQARILVAGKDILLDRNAELTARAGSITIHANPSGAGGRGATGAPGGEGSPGENRGQDGSFTMREGARIDASGLRDVERSVAENVFAVEVRSNELSASPKQRDGILHGETVYVDRRTGATIVDWTGALAGEMRTAQQMSTEGGNVQIRASNYAIVEDGAVIDVSGGSTRYLAGQVTTTYLTDGAGKLYDIADADPNRIYTGMRHVTSQIDGYLEGANAGSVQLLSPSSSLFGKLRGDVVAGEHQVLASLGRVSAPRMPSGAVGAASVTLPTMPTGGSADLHRGGPDYAPWTSTYAFIMADGEAFDGSIWTETGNNTDEFVETTLHLDPSLTGQDWSLYEGEQPRFIQFLEDDFFSGMASVTLGYGSSHESRVINPDVAITLQPGGSFTIGSEHGLTFIRDNVSITAPAGSIQLGAHEIGSDVALSVAADWINDIDASADLLRGYVDGGSISLYGNLTAPITIDAGGGGWYRQLAPGNTGSMSNGWLLVKSTIGSFDLIEGNGGSVLLGGQPIATLLGYADINVAGMKSGGSLSLNASGDVVIGPEGGATTLEGTEYIDDTLFQDMGIGSLMLLAGNVTVVDGANVQFRNRTLVLNETPDRIATGTKLSDAGTLALLPDHLRPGASLGFQSDSFTVEQGALLEVDPTGSLSLNSGAITIDGTVRVHGGTIAIGGPSGGGSITLGSTALIDASGVAQTIKVPGGADGRGFWYDGRILPGGSVNINAGSLMADAGSVIDVSGASGILGVWQPGRYRPIKSNVLIGSDAGAIDIRAGSGYLLSTLKGDGGTQYNYAGTVSLTGGTSPRLLIPGSTQSGLGIEYFGGRVRTSLRSYLRSGSAARQYMTFVEMWDNSPFLASAREQTGLTGADLLDFAVRDTPGSNPPLDSPFFDPIVALYAYGLQAMAVQPGMEYGMVFDPGMTTAPDIPPPSQGFPVSYQVPEGYDPVKFTNTMKAITAMINADFSGLQEGKAFVVGATPIENVRRFDTLNLSGKIGSRGPVDLSSQRVLSITGNLNATVDMTFRSRDIFLSGGGDDAIFAPTSGTLTISGETVQFGRTRFEVGGFETVVIEAQGDMRGDSLLQPNPGDVLTPGVYTTADLVLRAAQIYPTTDSMLRFESTSSIRVEQTGRRASPLSAGGNLILTAPLIQQAGTLRAPFGEISLIAVGTTDEAANYVEGRVELLDGSVTSTAADGRVILYGYTFDGQSWYAPLQPTTGGAELATPPEKRVSLTGDTIDVQAGATIDISGSGDVLGLEFVAGPLGQVNVLNEPGMYAIVPAYGDDVVAPIDPVYGTTGIGQAVWLAAFDGNPAGWYTLLPPEYALTPGGYLVSMAEEGQPGESSSRLLGDDSFAVRGYRGVTGTSIADQIQSTFRLERGTDVRVRSEFFETYGNSFFSSERFLAGLERSGLVFNDDPRLPIDGGFLTLAANQELVLDGDIIAGGLEGVTGSRGSRGGVVDITSDNIVIAAPDTDVSDLAGYLVLDPNKISGIAESLLIGGVRRQGAGGLEIVVGQTSRASAEEVRDPAKSVGAENVVIRTDADNPLTGAELLFAANQTVTVESGAVVRASGDGADADDIAIAPSMPVAVNQWGSVLDPAYDAGGAFLRVSNLGDISVSRSDLRVAGGDLLVETGATLEATDSVILDSTRNTVTEQGSTIRAGAITAAAGLVSFGEAPAGTAGFVASGETLAALGEASALTLKSYSTFDFYGDVALNLDSAVILDGAALVSRGDAPGTVSITSGGLLTLRNSDAVAVDETGVGGTLTLAGLNVVLAEGDIDIAYTDTVVNAGQRLIFDGQGNTSLDGTLTVHATEITGTSGAGHLVTAAGALSLLAQETPGELADFLTSGALIGFTGSEVLIGTRLRADSGTLRATAASGDVRLSETAVLDVSGSDVSFFEVDGFLPGGSIGLTSNNGDVLLGEGSVIDISGGASGGDAGALTLTAGRGIATLGGTINADVVDGFRGGSFGLTTSTLADFGGLNALLNEWKISRARNFAILDGDVLLNGTTRVDALTIVTGTGHITVASDAVIGSDSAKGGSIKLSSGGDLTIESGASLDVNAKGENERGGSVDIQVATGGVINAGAASIDVSGSGTGEAGVVRLRAPRVGDDVGVSGWAANVTGGDTTLEAFRIYDIADTDGDASNGFLAEIDIPLQQQALADAAAFFTANGGAIRTRLGQGGNAAFHLVAGIELRSEGDMELLYNWNLKDARYDGQPGVLTLRAGGDLLLNANLSDGFVNATRNAYTGAPLDPGLTNDLSWSYNLVAGADFQQTDVLAVSAGSGGDIRVNGMVRTGTGDINLAASGDLVYAEVPLIQYQSSSNVDTPSARVTVPAGTIIQAGTVLKPSVFAVKDTVSPTRTINPYLPAGTVLRRGTTVPAGTVLNGETLTVETVLATDVTLAADTSFPGEVRIAGLTTLGGDWVWELPSNRMGGPEALNQQNVAVSIPGMGDAFVNAVVDGRGGQSLTGPNGVSYGDVGAFDFEPIRYIDVPNAAIYTIGVAAAEVENYTPPTGGDYPGINYNPLYAEKGGDIAVNVGGGIRGSGAILPNAEWLLTAGYVGKAAHLGRYSGGMRDPDAVFQGQTSLALVPDRFRIGMGALGGGDIDIVTGGDVDNLLVALPTTVRVSGGRLEGEEKIVHTTGGGDLTMRVGGNLLGGVIQVSKGAGAIDVAGSVLATAQGNTEINGRPSSSTGQQAWDVGNTQMLTLALDDAQIALQAGGDILLRRVFSSTGGVTDAAWLGYTRDTQLSVTSLGGDIYMRGGGVVGTILPTRTSLIATAGSVNFGSPTAGMPFIGVDAWDNASLDLLAMESIQFWASVGSGQQGYTTMAISGNDPEWIGRVTTPGAVNVGSGEIKYPGAVNGYSPSEFHWFGPGFGVEGPNVHSGSDTFSRFYAVNGDIRSRNLAAVNALDSMGNFGTFYFGHEVRMKAGEDIRMGAIYQITHDGSDLPLMQAGGAIYRPNVILYGPGRLWVQAGDEIWMGDTAGAGIRAIEAVTGFADAVPVNGGSVTVLAGIDQDPHYQQFFDYYLNPENLSEAPEWLTEYYVESDIPGLTVSTPVVLADGETQTTVYAIELVNYMRGLRGEELIETEAPDEVSGSRPITRGKLAAVIDPAEYAAALAAFQALDPALQRPLAIKILNAELKTAGREAVGRSPETDGRSVRFGDPTRGYDAIGRLFPGAQRKPGEALAEGEYEWTGDLGMRVSQIRGESGGDVDLVVPGGSIQLASLAISNTDPGRAGVVTQRGGGINAITYGDYIVNQSRTMTADDGDILIWSSYGNIDAGRGRKTSLSVPPVVFPVDAWGQTRVQLSGLPNGAGIATLDQVDGRQGGDVDLYAFNGIVNAGDAGIRASRDLFIGALEIQGLDNITVGGVTNVDLTTDEGSIGALNVENFARRAEQDALDQAMDLSTSVEKLRTVRQTILTGSVVSFGTEDCVETETNRCPTER